MTHLVSGIPAAAASVYTDEESEIRRLVKTTPSQGLRYCYFRNDVALRHPSQTSVRGLPLASDGRGLRSAQRPRWGCGCGQQTTRSGEYRGRASRPEPGVRVRLGPVAVSLLDASSPPAFLDNLRCMPACFGRVPLSVPGECCGHDIGRAHRCSMDTSIARSRWRRSDPECGENIWFAQGLLIWPLWVKAAATPAVHLSAPTKSSTSALVGVGLEVGVGLGVGSDGGVRGVRGYEVYDEGYDELRVGWFTALPCDDNVPSQPLWRGMRLSAPQ